MEEQIWLLLAANFPLVAAFFIALQRGWIYIGRTYDNEIKNKNEDIAFREKLRQEAMEEAKLLRERDKEKTDAIKELTNVVSQSLDLNEKLVANDLKEWDGYDRRKRATTSRAR